ncbi:unnamed protein product [Ranitomeya imitator]|uniref:Helix-turn-helix domain-containing protein n=1 Tax=Ranitomeya imitator TaxID=111125 RepID=A0ABN9M3X8_9NEOB|nr:unnamed protein product [Ranitomeya imitator]
MYTYIITKRLLNIIRLEYQRNNTKTENPWEITYTAMVSLVMQILNKCSFDLITLTLEHLHKAIDTNAAKIKSIETQLSSTGTAEELSTLRTQIQERVDLHKRDTENRKRSKFSRDTIDYETNQVYRWHDNSTSRRQPARNQRSSTDYSTSGSDQERNALPSTSSLFLGQRRRFPKRKPDGAPPRRDTTDQMRITRSKCKTFDLEMDLQRFFRLLRLKTHFASSPINTPPPCTNPMSIVTLGLRDKSSFRPPQGSHAVETFIGFVQESFHTIRDDIEKGRLHYPSNLSATEYQALVTLQKDPNLIIKPADKGGALVIMDKAQYIAEIHRQLNDTSIYDRLSRDPSTEIRGKIDSIITKYSHLGIIDPKTSDFLRKKNPITPDSFYLQRRGTAMGSNVAPPYANTYMALFETSVIYKHPLFIHNVSMWKRYIDDVFCLWGGSLESLQEFFLFLNDAWPGIKFTISHDQNAINFLDTTVLKDSAGLLTTDLYSKPTDRNSLLHYQSFHPPSTKRSIPISQYQRVKRIVPDPILCEERLQGMTTKFLKRGYPSAILARSRDPPPQIARRNTEKRIPFMHAYHPFSFILHKTIRRHWHLLSTAHPDIPEFKEPFLPCFRRPPNLRDNLVKADIGPKDPRRQIFLSRPKTGTFPCLHCAQCNNIQKGNTFQHPRSGKTFHIKNFFTCDSTYVVYLIKCPCGLLYIGETTQPISFSTACCCLPEAVLQCFQLLTDVLISEMEAEEEEVQEL